MPAVAGGEGVGAGRHPVSAEHLREVFGPEQLGVEAEQVGHLGRPGQRPRRRHRRGLDPAEQGTLNLPPPVRGVRVGGQLSGEAVVERQLVEVVDQNC